MPSIGRIRSQYFGVGRSGGHSSPATTVELLGNLKTQSRIRLERPHLSKKWTTCLAQVESGKRQATCLLHSLVYMMKFVLCLTLIFCTLHSWAADRCSEAYDRKDIFPDNVITGFHSTMPDIMASIQSFQIRPRTMDLSGIQIDLLEAPTIVSVKDHRLEYYKNLVAWKTRSLKFQAIRIEAVDQSMVVRSYSDFVVEESLALFQLYFDHYASTGEDYPSTNGLMPTATLATDFQTTQLDTNSNSLARSLCGALKKQLDYLRAQGLQPALPEIKELRLAMYQMLWTSMTP